MMIMMTLVFGLIVLDIYNILNCVYQTIVDIYDKYIPYCVVVYIYAFLPLINTCSALIRRADGDKLPQTNAYLYF